MTNFTEYKSSYKTVKMEREDGILLLRLQSVEGGPLIWGQPGGANVEELCRAFGDVASDQENRVVIITGTGAIFTGPPAARDSYPRTDAEKWEVIRFNSMELTNNLLDIPVPVISCINGPAYRRVEMPFLADIVLAADDALVQDSGHFPNRLTPGDGVNLFFPLLMGWNRGRYFLLTGQTLHAQELMELGLVNEVMAREKLLPRAWELARQLCKQNPLVLRYTRLLLTAPLKMMAQQYLGYGLALEGLSAIHESTGRVGFRWE